MRQNTLTRCLYPCIPRVNTYNVLMRDSEDGNMANVSLYSGVPQGIMCSAMWRASRYGHAGIVAILLSAGANVHHLCDSCLATASSHGHLECVSTLIAAGADVDSQNGISLRFACYHGHTEIVNMLIKAGCDIHCQNEIALYWAALHNHDDVITILLAAGANVQDAIVGFRLCGSTADRFRKLIK